MPRPDGVQRPSDQAEAEAEMEGLELITIQDDSSCNSIFIITIVVNNINEIGFQE